MKSTLITILIVLLLTGGISSSIIGISKNDKYVANLTSDLQNSPTPDKTAVVEAESFVGKLSGSSEFKGKGVQYFSSILIKSELDEDQLKDYYSSVTVNGHSCNIEKQTSRIISQITEKTVEFTSDVNSSDYYIVYIWDTNDDFFNIMDFRK